MKIDIRGNEDLLEKVQSFIEENNLPFRIAEKDENTDEKMTGGGVSETTGGFNKVYDPPYVYFKNLFDRVFLKKKESYQMEEQEKKQNNDIFSRLFPEKKDDSKKVGNPPSPVPEKQINSKPAKTNRSTPDKTQSIFDFFYFPGTDKKEPEKQEPIEEKEFLEPIKQDQLKEEKEKLDLTENDDLLESDEPVEPVEPIDEPVASLEPVGPVQPENPTQTIEDKKIPNTIYIVDRFGKSVDENILKGTKLYFVSKTGIWL
jgi:hypothetical protein